MEQEEIRKMDEWTFGNFLLVRMRGGGVPGKTRDSFLEKKIGFKSRKQTPFSHHYEGSIDFYTVSFLRDVLPDTSLGIDLC